MRRVRFRDPAGVERVGEWTDRGIEFGGRVYDPGAVAVLPPVRPTKVIGIGANNPGFVEHSDDFGWPDEFSDHPQYVKTPDCVVGHGDTVTLPAGGTSSTNSNSASSGSTAGTYPRTPGWSCG